MAEMQWYAATDSGRFDGTAAITPRSGAVCLRAELPAGVLQNAVARFRGRWRTKKSFS